MKNKRIIIDATKGENNVKNLWLTKLWEKEKWPEGGLMLYLIRQYQLKELFY
jgi:hypothetical protein